MPKSNLPEDASYAFRHALLEDRHEADRMLKFRPYLIDEPVYGASESALHFFAIENEQEIVSWLITRGANPNGIADDNSPLISAAGLGL